MIDNPNHKDDLEKSDPDPEGTHEQDGMEKATRRQFSADTKRRILQAYDACQEPGEKGALLRREGIYSSYITTWRRQQERGELGGLTTKKRGPKRDAKQEELSKVKDENRRLRERLRQAELIIEAQKNLSDTWSAGGRGRRVRMMQVAAVDIGGDSDLYGRGLVDPFHAIYSQVGINSPMNVWTGNATTSGTMVDYTFDVPEGYEEVTVVLTWADEAGATEVINDLDLLYLQDGDGTTAGSSASSDDTVEYIKVPIGYVSGTWTIRVSATSIASSQPYALAAHSVSAPADLSITCLPEVYPGPEDYYSITQTISNTGYTAGGAYFGLTVLGVDIYPQEGYSKYRLLTGFTMSMVRISGRLR